MVDILHRVGVRSAGPEKVYEALTTIDGLAGWWTRDTTGDGDAGGVLKFRFPKGGFDMRVLKAEPGSRVTWEVIDGPAEWVGTTIDWTLRQDGEWTIVLFQHAGWAEPVEFMHHCSTKWATFLLSLKSVVETGSGTPAPDDVEIDDWNCPSRLATAAPAQTSAASGAPIVVTVVTNRFGSSPARPSATASAAAAT